MRWKRRKIEHRPGDRINGRCNDCGCSILFVCTVKLKLAPVDRIPFKADGNRQLTFADGSTGRTHPIFVIGHQSHFATCAAKRRA